MKNQKETIRKMVSYLNNSDQDGGFWLPNIQRQFVWKEDQIERLFDSIMREYPISTLLVWKTKSSIRIRKFIDNFRNNIKLTDFYIPDNEKTKMLVLDGQQRLQSLYIGLKGSYEKKELYFNILSGEIVAPEDIRYKFKFIEESKASFPWLKFKDLVFSNEAYFYIAQSIIDNNLKAITEIEKQRIYENIALVVKHFCSDEVIIYQELDSIDSPKTYSEDDVVEIFIRANSGGTTLGKSDLLFSLLSSAWEDADDRMEELISDLNKTGFAFNRDFVLKTCLSLLERGARYEVKKFRDETTKESIQNNWTRIANSIKSIKDFIESKTYIRSDKALSSYLGLIPLIFFNYHFPDKWGSAKGIDEYILRTLISSTFGGSPDNLIDKCTRRIQQDQDFILNEIYGVIKEDGRNIEISRNTILNLHYTSKDIHLIFNLLYKQFNYTPSYLNNLPQIDHIFPQSLLRTIKDVNPETGRKSLLRYKWEDRDQIANCMLLTADENGAKGKSDKSPEEWFSDKDDGYLDLHLIPKDKNLWKLEQFENFINARKELLLEKLSFLIQKET